MSTQKTKTDNKKKTRADGLREKKIVVGERMNGMKIRKSFYGRTDKEINRKIEEYRQQAAYGPIDKTITLKAWAERWLETYKTGTVSASTLNTTYENSVKKHIAPYFKDAKLAAIRAVDIQDFFRTLSSFSPSLVKSVKVTLNQIFEKAIENDLIVKNPVKGTRPKSDKQPAEKRAYTHDEAQQLITFALSHKDGIPIVVLLNTGLRRGELLALKWSDIYFKDKIMSVNRSVSEVNGKLIVGAPKTDASIADIPINELVCNVLALVSRHTVYHTGTKNKRIEHTVLNEYVFANSRGGLLSPRNWKSRIYDKFMKDYEAYCAENDLPTPRILNPHELRHTFGSLVYEATGDIYITSKLIRHASIDITAKVYIHETIDFKRDAIDKALKFTTDLRQKV